MNKLIITFFTISTFIFMSGVSYNPTIYCPIQTEMKFVPGESIGKLIIGETNKEGVEKIIGKVNKVDYKISFYNHHTSVVKFVYPNYGIELDYSDVKTPSAEDILNSVTLLKECLIKTEEGIGIGSTRGDIEKIYGKPLKSGFNRLIDESLYHTISYSDVRYTLHPPINVLESDSMNHKVIKIDMW